MTETMQTETEGEIEYHRGTKEWSRMRSFILFREGGRCYLCRVKLTQLRDAGRDCPTAFTLDHLLPVCKGGRSTLSNLRACCQKCNAEKADMVFKESSTG